MVKVSVYIVDVKKIEKNVEKYLSALSDSQRKKAEEYKIAGDYYRSIAGAYLVNKFTPDVPVFYGERGKPQKEGCCYNLSHSGDFAVLAVAGCEVGVDVEAIRNVDDGLIKKICSIEEIKAISSTEDFFTVWTMKESLLKCVGSGLISRLNDVPSIPEGLKEYGGEKYFSKSLTMRGSVISITLKTDEEFKIDLQTL